MGKVQSQYDKMTKTPIPSLIIRLSIPTIISMLITNIYNLADTAFVGRLGNSASGAVGVVFGFMSVLQAVGFMFGQGTGSIISRALGNKDPKRASAFVSTGFFGAFAFGLIISIISAFNIDRLVMLLGSTDTIAPYAKAYITCILVSAPFLTSSLLLNNVLRYEGKAMLGMIGLMVGGVLNIILDPILMFGFNMGIVGAGVATASTQIISFSILLSMFLRGKTTSVLSVRNIIWNPVSLFNIMATGFPSLLRQGLGSIATVMLNSFVRVYGDEAVAAMSIVSRIGFFVFAISLGIGQGFQPVSGFNYGAKKFARLRKAFWFTFFASEAFLILLMVICLIFSGDLIRLFRDDPRVVEIGTRALVLHVVSLAFSPPCMVTEMLFQSTGKRLAASIMSSLRNGLFFIPILAIFAQIRGLSGIQEAQPLANVLSAIPAVFFIIWFLRKMPHEDAPDPVAKE